MLLENQLVSAGLRQAHISPVRCNSIGYEIGANSPLIVVVGQAILGSADARQSGIFPSMPNYWKMAGFFKSLLCITSCCRGYLIMIVGVLLSLAFLVELVRRRVFSLMVSTVLIGMAGTAAAEQGMTAQPSGVVVASYSDLGNAKRQMDELAMQMRTRQIRLRVLPSRSGEKSLYRLVAQAYGVDSRVLLRQLRADGFVDAWHISSSSLTSTMNAIGDVRSTAIANRQRQMQPPISMTESSNDPQAIPETVRSQSLERRTAAQEQTPRAMGEFAGPGEQVVFGSEAGVDLHQLKIQTLDHEAAAIVIDGSIDEATWRRIPYYDNMGVSIPDTGADAEYPTKMRMFATEKGFFISADMVQPPETLVQRLTRRDDWVDRDLFGVTIDASGEAKLGYWFYVALGNALNDGKVLPERRFQRDWDGPWIAKASRTETGWSAEMYLPWSMMDMPAREGLRNMGFVASRMVSHRNQRYQWPGYGVTTKRYVSAFNRLQMEGVKPVPQKSVIPYIATAYDEVYNDTDIRIGADLAWKPSPAAQISASVNPDFGAVESDDVVLNLTASETFFPEKRLFFLEGSEVFNVMPRDDFSSIMRIALNEDFSTTSRRVYLQEHVPLPVSLLNTRRIGGTASQMRVPDSVTLDRGQVDVPTDLLGAAKITGSNDSLRYGVLAAFEDDVEWLAQDSNAQQITLTGQGRDFAVARVMYTAPKNTSWGYMGTYMSGSQFDTSVHSLDAHMTNEDGSFSSDAQLIMSDRDGVTGYGAMIDALYTASPNLRHKFELDVMDEDIDFNDLGFLRRNDYILGRYVFLYNKQNVSKNLSNYRSTLVVKQQHNISEGQVTDSAILWRSSVVLPGRNTLRAGIGYFPKRYEDIDSRGNGAYRVDGGGWFESVLATDAGKKASFSFGLGGAQEHLGDWSYNALIGLTYLPIDPISISMELRYKDRSGWLVYQGGRNFGAFDADEWQPSLDINWFIAPGHQLRWNLQWAGVRASDQGFYAVPSGDGDLMPVTRERDDYDFNISRLTTQLRYRWEIAPLTDFFLVYNRGNSLRLSDEYDVLDLFDESLQQPVIDTVVAKLRYRFGN